jgi:hypothetical protein
VEDQLQVIQFKVLVELVVVELLESNGGGVGNPGTINTGGGGGGNSTGGVPGTGGAGGSGIVIIRYKFNN